ncbi:MAG: hypothetical protein ERJ67_00090 [Aphanocapsa feldmannii 277cV]|uniref:Uncharacterized protein n=1 Tax=Aphanocapsa feldmannii 277cV TaxID=2507553 RepID=A0A524RR66_9CHRO|nr:MAG: hypothetical protein ERJ69_10000 [Aphanocapsa feldmannii 288cV]TGG96802.1 MAG: hypothetical protein ERJ67_00090 [Aphanocapsa feldmannii 277cV]
MASPESEHRRRIHELLLALIGRVEPLDLLDESNGEPSSWLERNRRVVKRYQALVHSAVTLDALVDQELGHSALGNPKTPPGR